MPEIVEVEIARRQLSRWTTGRVIAGVDRGPKLRLEGGGAPWAGRSVLSWHRRGKLIGATFKNSGLLVHLGMTGQWVADPSPDRSHCHLRIRFADGAGPASVGFIDPRRFGWLRWVDGDPRADGAWRKLGPDADGPWDGPALQRVLGGGRGRLKARLMDQHRIAGLGNIAAIEIAWHAGLDLSGPVAALNETDWAALARALRVHIDATFAAEGGGASDAPIAYLSAGKGAPNPFQIYGRAGTPCPRCGAEIQRSVTGGRPNYHCAACQSGP